MSNFHENFPITIFSGKFMKYFHFSDKKYLILILSKHFCGKCCNNVYTYERGNYITINEIFRYTPTLTTAVVSSNSANRSNFRPQLVTNAGQQTHGVAKHRLPMQINRQSPQVNRSLQHANLPSRNIAALARPIGPPSLTSQHSYTTSSIAGRVLASPVKDSTLDDDLLEGVVEKRPKYHKHLPLNYQVIYSK